MIKLFSDGNLWPQSMQRSICWLLCSWSRTGQPSSRRDSNLKDHCLGYTSGGINHSILVFFSTFHRCLRYELLLQIRVNIARDSDHSHWEMDLGLVETLQTSLEVLDVFESPWSSSSMQPSTSILRCKFLASKSIVLLTKFNLMSETACSKIINFKISC